MSIHQKGKLFVISGPSGVGKTTICNTVCQNVPKLFWSVSVTTRTKREGEIEGQNYYFVTIEEFEKRIVNQEFLEYASVHDNYYGTLRKPVEEGLQKGNHYLLEIDVQGGQNVKRAKPDSILIFITPPSIETLRQRLIDRNRDSLTVIEKRIKNAMKELESKSFYDFIVVNENLEQTIHEVQKIMEKTIQC